LDCVSCSVENARGTLLHLHGGGFRMGGPRRLAPFAAVVAARVGCTVIVPGYPLAPENPFPGAFHGLLAAFEELDADGPLVIGGDSAGGNLAVGMCLLGAQPDALMLISPWLDLRVQHAGFDRAAATDIMFSRESALDARAAYLQDHPPEDPLASPVLADISGLPPTFILAGGMEVLLDDSLDLAAKLATARVDVELRVVPDMQHVAPALNSEWDGSAAGLDAAIGFLKRYLGPAA
ncbi:MAG: hormone-sensitive lipase, partial [Caulobacteraceae bacterium]|nr:hormone-sensitive lipase [Caulobacteraceae bacterium]